MMVATTLKVTDGVACSSRKLISSELSIQDMVMDVAEVAVTTRLLGAYKIDSPLLPLSESSLLPMQLLMPRKMKDERIKMREKIISFFIIESSFLNIVYPAQQRWLPTVRRDGNCHLSINILIFYY